MIQSSRGVASLRRLLRPQQYQFPRSFSRYNGLVRVQHVRIKRPWLKRVTISLLAYTTATCVWAAVTLGPFLDEDEDEEEVSPDPIPTAGTKEGEDEDEDEDDSIFIPLARPRHVRGEYYAASDPEWQTFLRYSSDKKLLRSLAVEFVQVARDRVAKSRGMPDLIGTPVEIRDASMSFDFPLAAPPEYVQRGLEIRDDAILWTVRSIPNKEGDRLQKLFQPSPVAWSMLGASYFLITQKLRHIQNIFTQDTPKLETEAGKQELKPGSNLQLRNSSGGIIGAPQSDKAGYQSPASLNTSGSGSGGYQGRSQSTDNKDKSALQRLMVGPDPDALAAYAAFKMLMAKRAADEYVTPPKGSFTCNGLVQLRAPKGSCEVYARGLYDPETKKWVVVNLKLMSVRSNRRTPLGGK